MSVGEGIGCLLVWYVLHVNRRHASMRKGAADGTGEGEARVELHARQLLGCWCRRRSSFHLLFHILELRARLLHCRAHLVGVAMCQVMWRLIECSDRMSGDVRDFEQVAEGEGEVECLV